VQGIFLKITGEHCGICVSQLALFAHANLLYMLMYAINFPFHYRTFGEGSLHALSMYEREFPDRNRERNEREIQFHMPITLFHMLDLILLVAW
jgi:hypothetical protein